jgi:hypothetical protein
LQIPTCSFPAACAYGTALPALTVIRSLRTTLMRRPLDNGIRHQHRALAAEGAEAAYGAQEALGRSRDILDLRPAMERLPDAQIKVEF